MKTHLHLVIFLKTETGEAWKFRNGLHLAEDIFNIISFNANFLNFD